MIKVFCTNEDEQKHVIDSLYEYEYCPYEEITGKCPIVTVDGTNGRGSYEKYFCSFNGDCNTCYKTLVIKMTTREEVLEK